MCMFVCVRVLRLYYMCVCIRMLTEAFSILTIIVQKKKVTTTATLIYLLDKYCFRFAIFTAHKNNMYPSYVCI